MATLTSTSINVAGPFTPAQLVLSASDTFTYVPGNNSMLVFYNTTGVAVNVTLDGAGGTTVPVPGAGATTLDISAGLVVNVPANSYKAVRCDTINSYLQGVIAMTGGTGCTAVLLG